MKIKIFVLMMTTLCMQAHIPMGAIPDIPEGIVSALPDITFRVSDIKPALKNIAWAGLGIAGLTLAIHAKRVLWNKTHTWDGIDLRHTESKAGHLEVEGDMLKRETRQPVRYIGYFRWDRSLTNWFYKRTVYQINPADTDTSRGPVLLNQDGSLAVLQPVKYETDLQSVEEQRKSQFAWRGLVLSCILGAGLPWIIPGIIEGWNAPATRNFLRSCKPGSWSRFLKKS